jgi:hypothetical protein
MAAVEHALRPAWLVVRALPSMQVFRRMAALRADRGDPPMLVFAGR